MSESISGTRSSPRKRHDAGSDAGYLMQLAEHALPPSIHGSPLPASRSRGRPRKDSTTDATRTPNVSTAPIERRSSRRRAAFDQSESYDSQVGAFRCPVEGCSCLAETRNTLNYHIRCDHPDVKVQELSVITKVESPVKASASVPLSFHKNDPVGKQEPVEGEIDEQGGMRSLHQMERVEIRVPKNEESVSKDDDANMLEEVDIESDVEMEDYEKSSEDEDLEPDESNEEPKRRKPAYDENGQIVRRSRGRPRLEPGHAPGPRSRLRIADPTGRYPCYVVGCAWKGRYRSVRSAHIKAMHPNWVRPPKFALARVSRDGDLLYAGNRLEGDGPERALSCFVEGCPWRGNLKSSRMAHMRNHHKDVDLPNKKTPSGGYRPDGKFFCHVESCNWRGASRSTRSAHMRREHEQFINTVYTTRSVPCCDCSASLQSHKLFVDHMVNHHNVGGIVQREFTDPRDYEEWFDAVQESFSIDFIKRMGVKQTASYQVLYLYCSRGGGYRDPRFHKYNRNASMPVRLSIRARPSNMHHRASGLKCGRNCAAFLRVLNHQDGRLTVIGCVEHTGHRMGTPLLRLSQAEREVMDEYLYSVDHSTPLEAILDRLREQDGYTVDGYEVKEKLEEDVKQYVKAEDELLSLESLLKSELFADSLFGVNIDTEANNISFGIMTPAQQDLWKNHSKRVACIDELSLLLGRWELRMFPVFVFDENDIPRCAALYITQEKDKLPLLRHLKEVSESPPETLVTDCSPDLEEQIDEVYGTNTQFNVDLQIAEWHLLVEWANLCDQLVLNRVDRYTIICALRRFLRANDPRLFEAMMVEIFEALREMDLDELANFLDGQLTDRGFSKRWTPLQRNPLTDHCNPMLEIAVRILRDRFLSCNICKRIDEYTGLLLERINEFNQCTVGEVYPTGDPEPPRPIPAYWEEDPRYLAISQQMILDQDQHTFEHKRMMHKEEELVDPNTGEMIEMVEVLEDGYHEEIVVEEQEAQEGSVRSVAEGMTPRKRKLLEMFRKHVEEAPEDELDQYETTLSHHQGGASTSSSSSFSPSAHRTRYATPSMPIVVPAHQHQRVVSFRPSTRQRNVMIMMPREEEHILMEELAPMEEVHQEERHDGEIGNEEIVNDDTIDEEDEHHTNEAKTTK